MHQYCFNTKKTLNCCYYVLPLLFAVSTVKNLATVIEVQTLLPLFQDSYPGSSNEKAQLIDPSPPVTSSSTSDNLPTTPTRSKQKKRKGVELPSKDFEVRKLLFLRCQGVCWEVILLFLSFPLSSILSSLHLYISLCPLLPLYTPCLCPSLSLLLSLPSSSPSQSLDYDTCYNIPLKERLRSFTKRVGRLYSLTTHKTTVLCQPGM